ncbi:TetR/AcrR family transcriptional regulator [Spirillospora sp. NPDC047279]|uniref:TetR/AcrR family transcriptional regulator n=1 Tax=Spirillospora sp. NPDC047279 TaxID=3155478 RepID=UPI00340C8044
MAPSDPLADTPAPAPLGRRERKKLQTKERIVDCAVALFASRGYDLTTMEDIGEGADVSRATVFNYFARKEDIVIEVFGRRRARLAELVAEAMERTGDTPGRLHHVLTGLVGLYQDEPAAGRAILRAWLRAGGPLMPNAADSAALFTEIVRAGQVQGDVPPDLDVTLAGLVILDAYIGALFRWVDDEDGRYDLEENLMATLDLLLAGITRDSPT